MEPVTTFFSGLVNADTVFETADDEAKRHLIRQLGLEPEVNGDELHVHAGRPATIMMNRGDHPLWWWIFESIRNCLLFKARIDASLTAR